MANSGGQPVAAHVDKWAADGARYGKVLMRADVTTRPSPMPAAHPGAEPDADTRVGGRRVLVFSHMFPRQEADWGGIFVYEQVRALRRAGVDARVIVGDPHIIVRSTLRSRGFLSGIWNQYVVQRGPLAWRDMAGVPVLRVPFLASYQPFWGWLAARSYRWEVARRAAAIRASFPFELVHAHTAFLDGTAAAAVSKRFSAPFLLTEHTGPFSALTVTPGMRLQTEQAVNSANLVMAVSRHLRNAILAEIAVRHPERIGVLGNGVDLAQFGLHGVGAPSDGTVQVLWIGGFLPVKQPIMLIDAFAEAWARDGRLRLTMVGEGVLEAEIRQRIAERGLNQVVCIRGSASRFDVAALMRAHHFSIISSESETFCLVAVEAMACGRPVLTTRCGGPEETVGSRMHGELVDNDAESLADGMVRLAARLDEFDEVKLHQHVKNNWSYEIIASRLVRTYETMLNGNGVDGVA